ncbi:MAG TPA: hypothetical protein VGH47_00725 [Xanthobacteraceae bacterium]|jgi:hypothetical protein
MRFLVVDAEHRTVRLVEADDPQHVYELAGLDALHVDHAIVARSNELGLGIGIAVFEHGLFAPPAATFYFSIGRQMYAGNAVLYAFDAAGETISMPRSPPPVMFYRSYREVEAAIARDEIDRPQTMMNGAAIWAWPESPQ